MTRLEDLVTITAEGSTIGAGVSVAVEMKFQPTQTGDFSTWVAVNTTAGYAIFAMSGTSSLEPGMRGLVRL